MALNLSELNHSLQQNNKVKTSDARAFCNYAECVYNQDGLCCTGPELIFAGGMNEKGRPVMVCVACVKI